MSHTYTVRPIRSHTRCHYNRALNPELNKLASGDLRTEVGSKYLATNQIID